MTHVEPSEQCTREASRVAGHRITARRIGDGQPGDSVLVLAHDGAALSRWRMVGAHLEHGRAVEQWKASRKALKPGAAIVVWERGHVVRYQRCAPVAARDGGRPERAHHKMSCPFAKHGGQCCCHPNRPSRGAP